MREIPTNLELPIRILDLRSIQIGVMTEVGWLRVVVKDSQEIKKEKITIEIKILITNKRVGDSLTKMIFKKLEVIKEVVIRSKKIHTRVEEAIAVEEKEEIKEIIKEETIENREMRVTSTLEEVVGVEDEHQIEHDETIEGYLRFLREINLKQVKGVKEKFK